MVGPQFRFCLVELPVVAMVAISCAPSTPDSAVYLGLEDWNFGQENGDSGGQWSGNASLCSDGYDSFEWTLAALNTGYRTINHFVQFDESSGQYAYYDVHETLTQGSEFVIYCPPGAWTSLFINDHDRCGFSSYEAQQGDLVSLDIRELMSGVWSWDDYTCD